MNTIPIEYPSPNPDYELIDSGNGEKLEQFHGYNIIRPDPRVLWETSAPVHVWQKADAVFVRNTPESGTWNSKKNPPTPWHFHHADYTFLLRPTNFKHVGIFPEQAVNWQWLETIVKNRTPNLLNLFAYTGAATVIAAKTGAFVTHVDSVKSTIAWAKENSKINLVSPSAIRWIQDDAHTFVLREIKRGKTYDGIIMDPPRFGRGTRGEVWKLEHDLPKLLRSVKHILSASPLFILINAYTANISAIVLYRLLAELMGNTRGLLTFGELALKESSSGRLLPQGIFSRWQQPD